MTINSPRTYSVVRTPTSECESCPRPATMEARVGGTFDWLRCPGCARDELGFSIGVSGAMLAVLADERRYAAELADNIYGTPENMAAAAPWLGANDGSEPTEELPDGYAQVEPDRFDLLWVPAGVANYGKCTTCFDRPSILVAVSDNDDPCVTETMCRPCAVVELEAAATLRLAILEAEALSAVDEERATIEADLEEFGFVRVVVPPMSEEALRIHRDEVARSAPAIRARLMRAALRAVRARRAGVSEDELEDEEDDLDEYEQDECEVDDEEDDDESDLELVA